MEKIINKEMNTLIQFVFAIGYFSEFIMLCIVGYTLYPQYLEIAFFFVFLLVSGYINTLLKLWIKQPRPEGYKKFLYSEHHRKSVVYGMPSGHSQNVFYALTYLYLTVKDWAHWIPTGLTIAALMVYERYTFHNHTLLQLLAGAVTGIALGYLVVAIRDYSSSLILGAK
jgi:membrane-associated phospholipid phosphatase